MNIKESAELSKKRKSLKVIRRILLAVSVGVYAFRAYLKKDYDYFSGHYWAYNGLLCEYYLNILFYICLTCFFSYWLLLFLDKERKKFRKLISVISVLVMIPTVLLNLIWITETRNNMFTYRLYYYDTIQNKEIYRRRRADIFGNSYTAYYVKDGEYTYSFISDETPKLPEETNESEST